MFLLATLLSSCARIVVQSEFNSRGYKYPGSLIYCGTETAAGVCQYASAGLLFPIAFPFEFVADTLMLPYDLTKLIIYYANPPLNELIRSNKMNELARRLDNGADPNFVDTRYHGYMDGRSPRPPIMEAFRLGNMEAFKNLLNYGADVPIDLFNNKNGLSFFDFYKLAFERGAMNDKTQCFAAQSVVTNWIDFYVCKRHGINQKEFQQLHSIIKLFLENGFPPDDSLSTVPSIDAIQASKYLSDDEKEMFINLLRQYGGKTKPELIAEKKAIKLPPEIPIEDIPYRFKPVVDILQNTTRNIKYRYSATYDGVDSPVLVVDVGTPSHYPTSPEPYRTMTYIHHRETPTRWCQNGDPFDIPSVYRLVLTPKGVKVPSRIKGDMPRKDVILEEWLSLPTCEAYIERPIAPVDFFMTEDLDAIRRLGGASSQTPPFIHPFALGKHPSGIRTEPHHPLKNYFKMHIRTEYSKRTLRILEDTAKANRLLKEAGLKGKWFDYTYSSHRDLMHLAANIDHLVPYPDEILVVAGECSKTDDIFHDHLATQKDDYYWNCKAYQFPKNRKRGLFLYVFYGDEVPDDTITRIVDLAQKAFGK